MVVFLVIWLAIQRIAPVPGGPGLAGAVSAFAGLLVSVDVYWLLAGVLLMAYAWQQRRGVVETALLVGVVWLLLRLFGQALHFLVPCLAPNADAALGLLVALGLSYLLPLRRWLRRAALAALGVAALAQAYATRCYLPAYLAGLLGLGVLLVLGVSLAARWQPARRLYQRLAVWADSWAAGLARVQLTPALRGALEARFRRHLGVLVERIEPVGTDSSLASTPLVITGRTPLGQRHRFFVKILSQHNYRTSTASRMLRWLQGRGQVEGEPLWPTLKALAENEHYMSLFFTDVGVPVPRSRGLFRLERQVYALVSDYLEGARSLREAGGVPAVFVRRALEALACMREADCSHCDLKASNIMILPDDEVALVDLNTAEVLTSRKRLAQDLANMLTVLAMHHDPAGVVAIARQTIGDEALRRDVDHLHWAELTTETQELVPFDLTHRLRELIVHGAGAGEAEGESRL